MRKAVQDAFDFQKPYTPEMCRLCGLIFGSVFEQSKEHEDLLENTDIVSRARRIRIACRVRKIDEKYNTKNRKDELTIRLSRPSGAETELSKIMAGWGTAFFYGFQSTKNPRRFRRWTLLDLSKFRTMFGNEYEQNDWQGIHRKCVDKRIWCGREPNYDGPRASEFLWFDINGLNSHGLIIDASWL